MVFLRLAKAINYSIIYNLAKAAEKFPTGKARPIHKKYIQKQEDITQKMVAPWLCLMKLVTEQK